MAQLYNGQRDLGPGQPFLDPLLMGLGREEATALDAQA